MREKVPRNLRVPLLRHGAVCNSLPYEPHLLGARQQEEAVQLQVAAEDLGSGL